MTSVSIEGGVSSIGESVFDSCGALTSVSITNGVTSIGEKMFCKCHNLTSVLIPRSVTSIGEEAFYNCEKLTNIEFGGTKGLWKNIDKGSNWNKGIGRRVLVGAIVYGEYTVTCSDGILDEASF